MDTLKITLDSLINYNVQAKNREIVRRFLSERYSIKSGDLANQIVQDFLNQATSQVQNSTILSDYILSKVENNNDEHTIYDDATANKMDELLLAELDSGSIVLDEIDQVITQDDIFDLAVDLLLNKVSDSMNFDNDNISELKSWLSQQSLGNVIDSLSAGNYDELVEQFNETLQ